MKKAVSAVLFSTLVLAGCSASVQDTSASYIYLSDETTIQGNGLSINDGVVTIVKGGKYIVSGSSDNTTIDVNCEDEVELVLQDVSINAKSSAITISEAKHTAITLEGASTLTVSDVEEDAAGIYAHDDLSLQGSGTLNITSSADGIHANDSFDCTEATINIEAEDDGIDVNDSVDLTQCTITITTADGAVETMQSGGMGPQGDGGNMNGGFDPSQNMRPDGATPGEGTAGMQNAAPPQSGQSDGTMPPEKPEGNADMENFDPSQQTGEPPEGDPSMKEEGKPGAMMEESTEEEESAKSKGIKCDGDIHIVSGTITVNSADDAIHSNGNVTIEDGTISLQASDDGIHAEDTLTINNGTIDISMSYEGLEAKNIVINDGVISIVSSDDGINSTDASYTGNDMQSDSSLLTINGGEITIDATGDGIDMNGDGEMNGGTLIIYGPENGGNGAIDYAGTFNVNGGTLLASGASNMAQMPSSSSAINAVMLSVSGKVSVLDSTGNTIVSFASNKSYDNLVIASEDLKTNETYTICVDGEETSTVTIADTLTKA
mgnify:FL=1